MAAVYGTTSVHQHDRRARPGAGSSCPGHARTSEPAEIGARADITAAEHEHGQELADDGQERPACVSSCYSLREIVQLRPGYSCAVARGVP